MVECKDLVERTARLPNSDCLWTTSESSHARNKFFEISWRWSNHFYSVVKRLKLSIMAFQLFKTASSKTVSFPHFNRKRLKKIYWAAISVKPKRGTKETGRIDKGLHMVSSLNSEFPLMWKGLSIIHRSTLLLMLQEQDDSEWHQMENRKITAKIVTSTTKVKVKKVCSLGGVLSPLTS